MQGHQSAHHNVQAPASSSPATSTLYTATSTAFARPHTLFQRSSSDILNLAERRPLPPFYTAQDLGSTPPNEGSSVFGEGIRSGGGQSGAASPGQISVSLMHNPKRAYRQRRKDPSCDACRERKVKCDATETSSCTECSSRNVRCQFTKDTNRRMSSIKQVQDLERQLHEARQQLEQIRAVEQKGDYYSDYSSSDPIAQSATAELPSVGRSPRRMLKARTPQDLTNARVQLTDFGRGLLKPPVTSAQARQARLTPQGTDLPPLPPRASADHYLHYYFECVHRHFPVLHWTSFHQNYVAAFEPSGLQSMPTEWIAVLFVVLACGALSTRDPSRLQEAQDYMTQAVSTVNFWEDDVSTNQAIVAFLASIFLCEVNRKSASWIWLGSAIRIAQDLGLHVQGGQWSPIEGEMRKRIWYSFYVWDRLLATELGKPMLINDDECDTEYPEVLDDERFDSDDSHPPPPTLLLATIHVARLLAPLAKSFRSLCITNETLAKFESHLGDCQQYFPTPLQLSSTAALDSGKMAPLIYFQNARLMLHRHNLSPSCSPEQRAQAIGHCLNASIDTANVVSRAMVSQSPSYEWEQRLVLSATTMVCTHFWRCMLFLMFRPLDERFFVLLKASATVGSTKAINMCCGRHLSFCLRRLIERHEQHGAVDLDQDEEVLVYLSGDLQASTNSWVWGNAETGTHLSRRQKHGRPKQTAQEQEHVSPTSAQSPSWDTMLSEEEQHDWGGWSHIERAARYLQQLQEKLKEQSHTRSNTSLPRLVTHPGVISSPAAMTLPSISPASQSTESSTRSRMTIANII